MATIFNRLSFMLDALDRNQVSLPMSFAFTGTADGYSDGYPSLMNPTALKGDGYSTIVWDGYGEYTLTLKDKFKSLIAASTNVQLASVAPVFCQLGTVDLSAKTIKLHVLNASGVTDPASNANNRCNIILRLKK